MTVRLAIHDVITAMDTNMERPKVAAVYVRVSTHKQDAENQKQALIPYCEKRGYVIGQIYTDIVSGSEDNRPAFNALFRDAHMCKFDVLVFWALDRFSRSGIYFTIQKLQELRKLNIDWDSYQEQYFRTIGPFGDAVLGIMATIAKIERERLSERTKAGLARKRATGWVPGRKKGVPDKKPRRRKGYYDNQNRKQSNKGGGQVGASNPPEIVRYGGQYLGFEDKERPVINGPVQENKGGEE
jgi:DNA invertase Pin-like site-specific DNA recombinase